MSSVSRIGAHPAYGYQPYSRSNGYKPLVPPIAKIVHDAASLYSQGRVQAAHQAISQIPLKTTHNPILQAIRLEAESVQSARGRLRSQETLEEPSSHYNRIPAIGQGVEQVVRAAIPNRQYPAREKTGYTPPVVPTEIAVQTQGHGLEAQLALGHDSRLRGALPVDLIARGAAHDYLDNKVLKVIEENQKGKKAAAQADVPNQIVDHVIHGKGLASSNQIYGIVNEMVATAVPIFGNHIDVLPVDRNATIEPTIITQ